LLSVLLQTQSAQRFSSQHLAAGLTPNLAELVPSGFFCPQPWFLRRFEHIFARKNTPIYRNTVTCVARVTSNRVDVDCLNSQHLAMVRTSNIPDLVPSRIFCLQPWFLQRSEHIFPRKTLVCISIELRSINSCLSIKMKP